MFRKLLHPFYALFVLVSFFVCLVTLFPLIFFIGMRDRPFAREFIWHIARYWAKAWLWFIGMPLRVSGPLPTTMSKYVVVANHISYLDTICIYAAMPCYFRALAKKEMARIPVFGFIYKQLSVLVDRSSPNSRGKSMRLMWRVLKNEANIVIFPEGTFNETGAPLKKFYDGAFRLAVSAQTPVVPLVFPDTNKRWHFSGWWKINPGTNRAVFLDPVDVKGMTMSDIPALKEKVYKLMEQELLKFDNNNSKAKSSVLV
jgi:1-acyl-sn-glycerol-3-phosphate acyltransferase